MSASSPTHLYFLRHGEVEEPYQRVFGGRLDIGLSEKGRAQARAVSACLQGRHWDGIYASPMRRVRLTLEPLLATNGYQPVWLEGLREVDFGSWTGHTWEEVRERFQQSPFDWLLELEQGGIAGAESGKGFQGRVAACLDQVLARHGGGTVLVACHGGVVRAALAHLLGLPLSKMVHFVVDYASLTVVDHRPGRPEVRVLNYTPWREGL